MTQTIGNKVDVPDLVIACRTRSTQIRFAVERCEETLRKDGGKLTHYDLSELPAAVDVLVICGEDDARTLSSNGIEITLDGNLKKEGFEIRRCKGKKKEILCVLASDETGAMYGVLELGEQLSLHGSPDKIQPRVSNPRFEFRGIKFNLPWSSYRRGKAMQLHTDTCRDLDFWRAFLEMMAVNRFNVLTLWNLHPFTFMIRPEGYPEACPFNDEELAQWKSFWKELFRIARDLGIETYIVNWNICISPELARARSLEERNDTSQFVRDYTRQCVTQTINEYEDLTGLGVTLADWMKDMTPREREDWIRETFIEGIKLANRPVKFIHRSVLAGDPAEMRHLIDNAPLPHPVWVEVKFNWSHGHSTPTLVLTHDHKSGKIDERFWDPKPDNYKLAWMIRNEDFFILRWGEPGFIREHVATNSHDYVGGYFVGSEGYIPAKDYSHREHPHRNWDYAFQKQWLFYMLWGRLLYDPDTPDAIFAHAFATRYGEQSGDRMFRAYCLASRTPLRIASQFLGTWDFSLYSEGFLAPVLSKARGFDDGVSPFISIDELIDHQVLDPTHVSIVDYVKRTTNGESFPSETVTPPLLAEQSESDSREVLDIVHALRKELTPETGAMECELDDLETWGYLGLYLADKLRAGVALQTYRTTGAAQEQQKAIALLQSASSHWAHLSQITDAHYHNVPHPAVETFSWSKYTDQVQRDIQIAQNG